MATRAFRSLWRAQRQVLGNDKAASAEAQRRIRAEFRRNSAVSAEEAVRLIKTAEDTAALAKASIVQAQLDPKTGRYRAKVSRHHATVKAVEDEANQSVNALRKDHDVGLRERNEGDARGPIIPLRIDANVRSKLHLVRGDITLFEGDALVNAAQETLTGGGGLDQIVHARAGEELRRECEGLPFVSPGVRCPSGEARITRGYKLPCKHVIHAVGPIGEDPPALKRTYQSILRVADENKLQSLALPCISTGYFGFPMLPAARIAIETVVAFLRQHKNTTIQSVTFTIYNDVEFSIYQALLVKPKKVKQYRPRLESDNSACVLVIDSNPQNNWYAAFRNKRFSGKPIRVEQTAWTNIVHSRASAEHGVMFDLEPTHLETPFGSSQAQHRSVVPHLVIVRTFARGAKDEQFLNHLFCLKIAGVPCINGIESLLDFYHRANAIHAMTVVEQKIADPKVFQAVPIDFYSNLRELFFRPEYPCVAKVGSCHAGSGKMRFMNAQQGFDDFHGLVSMSRDYVTLEPFLDRASEYRLQRMGSKVRCFSRASLTHDWKANQGEGAVQDMEVTARHLKIAAAIDELYPHFHIWSADVLITKDGEEFCLEINDSSTGFNPNHFQEDMEAIVDCAMQRLQDEYQNY